MGFNRSERYVFLFLKTRLEKFSTSLKFKPPGKLIFISHYQGVIMKFLPWLALLSMVLFVGCSGSKSAQPVNQEVPQVELSSTDEFIDTPEENPVADASSDQYPLDPTDELAPSQAPGLDQQVVADQDPAAPSMITSSSIEGSEQIYEVQKNETLMMVAFKLYGDYGRWKEIANHNQDSLKGKTSVMAGTKLKYRAPAQAFVWNPEGLPYLIKTGDTLGKISKNVYQTQKKWKIIWNNNRPLIKDPNKIFAGFTLYYPENGREVAAEL
jgi:nucleoid-associated protein YgaU